MKNLLSLIVVTMFTFFVSNTAIAQGTEEGSVTYSVKISGLDEATASMMGDMTMTTYFQEGMVRADMSMAMMNTSTIFNEETKTVNTLMDVMGNKINMELSEEEYEEQRKDAEGQMTDYKIVYKDDVKEIAGYECKRALIKLEDMTLEVYVTDEIKASNTFTKTYEELKGYPLQFEMDQQGMKMLCTATEVKMEDIEDSKFDVPEGYKKMSMEEMQQMFGGMGQ